ncbi:MAG TPA: LapA family protein [Desulfitobacteriaceae bacterium]|nr:LapA family protein [Desulfitobacteriaceae bacterium]
MFALILMFIFVFLIVVFTVQNALPVTVNFFWFKAQVSLVFVILGSVLAGVIIALLIALWYKYRKKRKKKEKDSPMIGLLH